MKVIATAVGFFACLRQPGDSFEVPDDTKPASWFKPVDPPAEAKAGKAGKAASPPKADSTDLA